MTKSSLVCSLILTLVLGACASQPKQGSSASAAPAGSTSAVAQAAPAKPKLVCEEQKPLGSNLPQRICMTPEEAAARQKDARDKMQNMQNNSASTVREGGPPR